MDEPWLATVHLIVRAIEVAGVSIIVLGMAISLFRFQKHARTGEGKDAYQTLRSNVGRSILLGLEFLVAADIINTVAIEPTLDSLAVLAAIVAIRTFLSFSLEVELEGSWPWNRSRKGDTTEEDGGRTRART